MAGVGDKFEFGAGDHARRDRDGRCGRDRIMLADEKERASLERDEAFGADVRRHQRFRGLDGMVEALDRLIEERQFFVLASKLLAESALYKVFRDWTRGRLR